MKKLVSLLSIVGAFACLAIVWIPVLTYYDVASPELEDAEIERLRQQPASSVLSELAGMQTALRIEISDNDILRVAGNLHDGTFEFPKLGQTTIVLPFDKRDLSAIPERFHLKFASQYAPVILLLAYDMTGDPSHLELATDMLVGWAEYDSKAILPRGLQWNDHATASVAYALTRFWSQYRGTDGFDPAVAKIILAAAIRTASRLARDRGFTASTNHGIMQSLALLHLTIAFPNLASIAEHRDLAQQRLAAQLEYYISDEGVILEHSPHYHQYGLRLLADYARYHTLLSQPVGSDFAERYNKALEVYAAMHRDDGTLPKIGDTKGPAEPMRRVTLDDSGYATRPKHQVPGVAEDGAYIYPASGFAIWWSTLDPGTTRRQLAFSWSRYPSLAHKHADDLGLVLWDSSGDLLTSSGYWPYWSPLRQQAISWAASNAPHFAAEPTDSEISTALLGHFFSAEFGVIDGVRTTAAGNKFRRQVIRLADDKLLIIDAVARSPLDGSSEVEIVWTGAPDHELEALGDGEGFVFVRPESRSSMTLVATSDKDVALRPYTGVADPFRGWTFTPEQLAPAPAVEISAWLSQWVVTSIALSDSGEAAEPLKVSMTRWDSPDDWRLEVQSGSTKTAVRRNFDEFLIEEDSAEFRVSVEDLMDAGRSAESERIRSAYKETIERYPVHKTYLPYREQVSVVVLVLFLAQEILVALLARYVNRLVIPARGISVLFWIGFSWWLAVSYFT